MLFSCDFYPQALIKLCLYPLCHSLSPCLSLSLSVCLTNFLPSTLSFFFYFSFFLTLISVFLLSIQLSFSIPPSVSFPLFLLHFFSCLSLFFSFLLSSSLPLLSPSVLRVRLRNDISCSQSNTPQLGKKPIKTECSFQVEEKEEEENTVYAKTKMRYSVFFSSLSLLHGSHYLFSVLFFAVTNVQSDHRFVGSLVVMSSAQNYSYYSKSFEVSSSSQLPLSPPHSLVTLYPFCPTLTPFLPFANSVDAHCPGDSIRSH